MEYIQQIRATGMNADIKYLYITGSNPELNTKARMNVTGNGHHGLLKKIHVNPTVINSVLLKLKYFNNILSPIKIEITTKAKENTARMMSNSVNCSTPINNVFHLLNFFNYINNLGHNIYSSSFKSILIFMRCKKNFPLLMLE